MLLLVILLYILFPGILVVQMSDDSWDFVCIVVIDMVVDVIIVIYIIVDIVWIVVVQMSDADDSHREPLE